MTILFGLEIEKFIVNNKNELVIVPDNIPHDDEGLQIEARGEPSQDIYQAVGSVLGELYKIQKQISKENLKFSDKAFIKVDKDLKLQLRRRFTKGVISYQNLYNYKRHKVSQNMSTAGIHISVTNQREHSYQKTKGGKWEYFKYNVPFDFVQFFKYLDKQFEQDIKLNKRAPGFYEIKYDGRIEYRSLPTTVDLQILANVIANYKFEE